MVTRGPWVVPGHCQGVARWFLGAKRMCWKVEKKVFLAPWHQEGWVLGVPSCIIVSNVTPKGDRLMRKVLQGDNLAPFSSDKIQAKILDLGYGGAQRALHNL